MVLLLDRSCCVKYFFNHRAHREHREKTSAVQLIFSRCARWLNYRLIQQRFLDLEIFILLKYLKLWSHFKSFIFQRTYEPNETSQYSRFS